MASTTTTTHSGAAVSSRQTALAVAGAMLAIGIGLVYLAGFANADLLHNGAHDSRHSFVLPCH